MLLLRLKVITITLQLTQTINKVYYIPIPPGWGIKEKDKMVADKTKVLRLLKTARGQLDAVIKMVEDDRYCVDISHQLMATEGLLANANRQVLTAHLKHCVNNAATEDDRNEKVDELIGLMSKIMK